MSYTLAPGASFEATLTGAPSGLTGTLGVRIIDNVGGTPLARQTTGIAEFPAGSGFYSVTLTAPTIAGQYTIMWDTGVVSPSTTFTDELDVTTSALIAVPSGAAYFTVAEARKTKPLDNATLYPDADINEMRVAVEEALEHSCGVAFVTRVATEVRDGNGGTEILLDHPRPTEITSGVVDGEALAPSDIAGLVLYPDGRVYNPNGWNTGRGNVTLTFTHGYSNVPGRVKRAAIRLTKRFLVDSPISDRATMHQGEDGTTQYFVTAGVRDAIFDVPEANAIVQDYGVRFGVS